MKEEQIVVKCVECQNSTDICSLSTCCENIYCLSCKEEILQFKEDCQHCPTSIYGFQSMPCFTTALRTIDMMHPTPYNNCRAHYNREISHYCTCCREFLCQFCVSEYHPQHRTRPITQLYEYYKVHLDNSVNLMGQLYQKLEKDGGIRGRNQKIHTRQIDQCQPSHDKILLQCYNYDHQISYQMECFSTLLQQAIAIQKLPKLEYIRHFEKIQNLLQDNYKFSDRSIRVLIAIDQPLQQDEYNLQRRDVSYWQNNTIEVKGQECSITINQIDFEIIGFKILWKCMRPKQGQINISIDSDGDVQKQQTDISKNRYNKSINIKLNVPRYNQKAISSKRFQININFIFNIVKEKRIYKPRTQNKQTRKQEQATRQNFKQV